MDTIGKLIGGIVGLGAAFGAIALIVTNPFIAGVVGGVLWGQNFTKAETVRWYEANYERVCPEYQAASVWERWTDSNLGLIGWCDDYIDRL